MTAEEVRAIIDAEIGGGNVVNGVDLSSCLAVPRLVSCHEPLPNPNKKLLRLWIVFDERPVTKDGYLIVFDEQHEFGLAVWGGDGETLVVIGYYGGFVETLRGM